MQAFAIMEEDLGRKLEQVFSSISERPIAAASLGQVPPCLLSPADTAHMAKENPKTNAARANGMSLMDYSSICKYEVQLLRRTSE